MEVKNYQPTSVLLSILLHSILAGGLILADRRIRERAGNPEPKDEFIHYFELIEPSEKSEAPVVDNNSRDLQIAGVQDLQQPSQYGAKAESASSEISIKEIPAAARDGSEKTEHPVKKVTKPKISEAPAARKIVDSAKVIPSRADVPAKNSSDSNSGIGAVAVQDVAANGNSIQNSASAISQQLKASYEQVVLSKLQKVKRYPGRALDRGLEGDVTLKLEIDGKGEVIESEISKSSGYSFFDDEVLEMVERASPFPGNNNDAVFSYVIPIAFRLED